MIEYVGGIKTKLPSDSSASNIDQSLFPSFAELFIELKGHTDATGTASYNLNLSNLRAMSVAKYISGQGIDMNRIKIVAFGESKLLNQNAPDKNYLNRRVEFKLYK